MKLNNRKFNYFLFLILNLISCNENLVIHIIPHSHNDLGWLKTVDEYFKCIY